MRAYTRWGHAHRLGAGHEDYRYGRLRAVALLRRREFCQRGKVDVGLGLQMTGVDGKRQAASGGS
jgi:hypothetical protein